MPERSNVTEGIGYIVYRLGCVVREGCLQVCLRLKTEENVLTRQLAGRAGGFSIMNHYHGAAFNVKARLPRPRLGMTVTAIAGAGGSDKMERWPGILPHPQYKQVQV